jgi:L-cystine uptake protein TcyP (sodium:dicarboxylate symporter family)
MIISILVTAVMFLFVGILYSLKFKFQKISLGAQIILGLFLGVFYGFILKVTAPQNLSFIKDVMMLMGQGYLGLLKMLVVPLILTSIIHAVLNVGNESALTVENDTSSSLKKLSILACVVLLGMTAFSALIGICVGLMFHVGKGIAITNVMNAPQHASVPLVDTLLKMLPVNPVASMMQENSIAIVLFALLLGIAARKLKGIESDKMKTFSQLIAAMFSVVKNLTQLVLSLTPYGIFALIALLIFMQGTIILSGLLNFIFAMYVSMIVVIFLHSIVVFLTTGLSPLQYFKNAYMPLFVAFTTRSSFATLPVTEETLRDKFKTRQVVSTLVPSIGATIGMNACAGIFPAMLVVMTLTISHQAMTWQLALSVMFINAVASLGISGIPGTAFIAASVTLTSLNLPLTVLGIVQGIDPIIDMGRTAVNVNGVMTTALASERLTAYND